MTPELRKQIEECMKMAADANLFKPIARIYQPDAAVYIDWRNPYHGNIEQVATLMWPSHPIEKTEEVEQTYESIASLWESAPPDFILRLCKIALASEGLVERVKKMDCECGGESHCSDYSFESLQCYRCEALAKFRSEIVEV